MYVVFEHTADLGIRVEAPDVNRLFAEAGQALFSIIVGNLDEVHAVETAMFSIAGESKDFLLVDWLAELLFLFDTRRLLLNEFDITIDANGLSGRGRGETFDPTRHRLDHEVKAITYHGLKVEQTGQRWLAEVIVDI